MDDLDTLVRRIREKASSSAHQLPPPATPEALREAEDALGLQLPALLIDIYTQVADGGFGPGDQVSIPGYTVGRLYSIRQMREIYFENREAIPGSPYTPWPDGVIPMLNWGGFSEAAIDCLDTNAPVLRYDSDVDAVRPGSAWKLDAPDLRTWWVRWLEDSLTEPTELWERRHH